MLNVKSTQDWINLFLKHKQDYEKVSKYTYKLYKSKLKMLTDYFNTYDEGYILTYSDLQYFFWYIDEKKYEPSTVKTIYTVIRIFFNWCSYMDEDFINPMTRIKPPKIKPKVLDPLKVEDLKKMVEHSDTRFAGILMTLADTGCRATELLAIDRGNCDVITGEILLKKTKNGKQRRVYVGTKTRRILKKYLKERKDNDPALFVGWNGRLSYSALNGLLKRRAKEAGVEPPPTLHSIRRMFTLSAARKNISLPVLATVLGHSGYGSLHRYLKLTGEDIQTASERTSVVDDNL